MRNSHRILRSNLNGTRNRATLVAAALAVVALIPLPGCIGWLFWQEINCWDRAWSAWEAEIANWPDVAVRIANNTDATASVGLTSAGVFMPDCGFWFMGSGGDPNYQTADDESLLVAAHGTATGTIKCGELMAITVRAPYDLSEDPSYYGWYGDYAYGLYLEPGNVALSGVGVTTDNGFSGDTVALIRYVRQVEDGLDCATDTLVITIETLGTARVVDPETGAIISSATPGTGTVSIE